MNDPPRPVAHAADEPGLGGTLETWLSLESARTARSFRAHLTALFSLPVGALVLWPGLLEGVARRAVLTGWGLSLAATVGAFVSEAWLTWRALRRRAR